MDPGRLFCVKLSKPTLICGLCRLSDPRKHPGRRVREVGAECAFFAAQEIRNGVCTQKSNTQVACKTIVFWNTAPLRCLGVGRHNHSITCTSTFWQSIGHDPHNATEEPRHYHSQQSQTNDRFTVEALEQLRPIPPVLFGGTKVFNGLNNVPRMFDRGSPTTWKWRVVLTKR